MLDLGKTIQALREQKGMSQKELAKRAGVSTGAIGNYEAGLRRPKFETIEALADVFNVPMGTLLGDEQTSRLLMYYERKKTRRIALNGAVLRVFGVFMLFFKLSNLTENRHI